jgi:hypothetical protein
MTVKCAFRWMLRRCRGCKLSSAHSNLTKYSYTPVSSRAGTHVMVLTDQQTKLLSDELSLAQGIMVQHKGRPDQTSKTMPTLWHLPPDQSRQ